MVHATVSHLEEHYADLKAKSFFPGLVKYMASGQSHSTALDFVGLMLERSGQDPLFVWFGRVRRSSRLVESCSVLPTRETLLLELFEVTTLSTSGETSATDPMPSMRTSSFLPTLLLSFWLPPPFRCSYVDARARNTWTKEPDNSLDSSQRQARNCSLVPRRTHSVQPQQLYLGLRISFPQLEFLAGINLCIAIRCFLSFECVGLAVRCELCESAGGGITNLEPF